MTTLADLAAIKELREAASPGPWATGAFGAILGERDDWLGRMEPNQVGETKQQANAQLAAQAPPLAKACEALGAALDGCDPWFFNDQIGEVWVCMFCEARVETLDVAQDQHKADCPRQLALATIPKLAKEEHDG